MQVGSSSTEHHACPHNKTKKHVMLPPLSQIFGTANPEPLDTSYPMVVFSALTILWMHLQPTEIRQRSQRPDLTITPTQQSGKKGPTTAPTQLRILQSSSSNFPEKTEFENGSQCVVTRSVRIMPVQAGCSWKACVALQSRALLDRDGPDLRKIDVI